MIQKKTAELTLEFGPKFTLTYEYLVLNDSGDYRLIAWEPLPPDAPSDEFGPDLVLDCPVNSEQEVDSKIMRALTDAMCQMIRAYVIIR